MIICKNCNCEMERASSHCPECGTELEFTKSELSEIADSFKEALRNKEYEAVVEYCKILANAGMTDYEREYGRMLEKGDLVQRNYDEAMKYFLLAAKKHEPYSAYRYSRLVSRGNERAGCFWLVYSAILGCTDAYPAAAEALTKDGKNEEANYFYILSTRLDDVDSIVEMAQRYYKGIGVAANSEYAKWYMDKLSFPPLYAFKLAYKLKGISPKEPPEFIIDREALIRRLALEADKCGFKEPYFKLNKMLAELENTDAMTLVASLLIRGVGCEKNPEEAIRILTEAATLGSKEAYLALGKLFVDGTHTEKEPELALRYLEAAGNLGSYEAYEIIGGLYESGEMLKKDFKTAEEYYRRAANGGIATAGKKAEKIASERERFFNDGVELSAVNPEKSFRAFAIAAAMGHKSAPMKLAECYLKGLGTEQDNFSAFYWYRTAAEGGDDRALYPLGLCLLNGIGINRDFGLARAVLERAVRLGSEGAKRSLKKLLEGKKNKLSEKLYSKGMRLIYSKKYEPALNSLELARELGNAKAIYTLGCMHEFGLGTESDRILAARLYEESFGLGFSDERSQYKKIILKLIR